jgi:hypothetical protein
VAIILGGARVDGRSGFQQGHFAGVGQCNRAVLDPVRDDDELPFFDDLFAVAKLRRQSASVDEKQLGFMLVVMPVESPFELGPA